MSEREAIYPIRYRYSLQNSYSLGRPANNIPFSLYFGGFGTLLRKRHAGRDSFAYGLKYGCPPIGPVAAIVGMLFWGWLWGVMGVLLAVPLTACIKLIADWHPSLVHISNLLAERPRAIPNWAYTGPVSVARAIPFLRKRLQADPKQ
jgi:hypothetical protein